MSHQEPKRTFEVQDALPEALQKRLERAGRSSIVVPGAEGWRHRSTDVDLDRTILREQSFDLMQSSLERIQERSFSPEEAALFKPEGSTEI